MDIKLIALHENKAHLESVAATLNIAANKLLSLSMSSSETTKALNTLKANLASIDDAIGETSALIAGGGGEDDQPDNQILEIDSKDDRIFVIAVKHMVRRAEQNRKAPLKSVITCPVCLTKLHKLDRKTVFCSNSGAGNCKNRYYTKVRSPRFIRLNTLEG
ncbi:hypothetical protein SM030_00092 [Vibrio phage vB_VpaS_sm030]|nr:hypothetical protein [Vibrio phage vB_VpaS_VP-RY-9]CAH0448225.1 hypothetical protein SM030_00092 [Vibrio phage vB_VpaS_sm030]CAI5930314.1 hypothetical protein SM031_00092 [Vibrio phage vB_VpaS_sm030]CAI6013154.1 hypothetical protein SM032_00092 [Vibrio phage vB_VpaS_sm030]